MVDLCLFLEETSYGHGADRRLRRRRSSSPAPTSASAPRSRSSEMLGGVVDGEVEAIAMSEPGAGSDVGALQLQGRAPRRRLRGQRAEDVDLRRPHRRPHPARRAHRREGAKHEGLTMFSVPGRRRRAWRSAGSRRWAARRSTTSSSPTATCPPTPSSGSEGQGWTQLMAGLNVERLILAALMLGARAARVRRHRSPTSRSASSSAGRSARFQALRAPHRRPRHRDRVLPAARPTTSPRTSTPNPDALFPREASMAKLKVTETAKQRRARGHADDGRLRLRDRVRHGAPRAHDARLDRSTAARARSSATSSARPTGSEEAPPARRAACP